MSVKGDWPRPTAKPCEGARTAEVDVFPASCTQQLGWLPADGFARPDYCGGELRLLARRFPTPGTVGAQCAKCGQKYEAPE